jgi:hypothetical protein
MFSIGLVDRATSLQVKMYALAWREMTGRVPQRVELRFIETTSPRITRTVRCAVRCVMSYSDAADEPLPRRPGPRRYEYAVGGLSDFVPDALISRRHAHSIATSSVRRCRASRRWW